MWKPFERNRTADTRQPREKMRQHQGFSGSPRIRTWTVAGLSRFPLPVGAASHTMLFSGSSGIRTWTVAVLDRFPLPIGVMSQSILSSSSPWIRTWTVTGLSRFPLPIGVASHHILPATHRDSNLDCGGSGPLPGSEQLPSASWGSEP